MTDAELKEIEDAYEDSRGDYDEIRWDRCGDSIPKLIEAVRAANIQVESAWNALDDIRKHSRQMREVIFLRPQGPSEIQYKAFADAVTRVEKFLGIEELIKGGSTDREQVETEKEKAMSTDIDPGIMMPDPHPSVTKRIGISFTLPDGCNKRSFLYGYECGSKAAMDVKPGKPWAFMVISNHQDEHQETYRDYTQVPIVNVPCGCGDPNCWLIQWSSKE